MYRPCLLIVFNDRSSRLLVALPLEGRLTMFDIVLSRIAKGSGALFTKLGEQRN